MSGLEGSTEQTKDCEPSNFARAVECPTHGVSTPPRVDSKRQKRVPSLRRSRAGASGGGYWNCWVGRYPDELKAFRTERRPGTGGARRGGARRPPGRDAGAAGPGAAGGDDRRTAGRRRRSAGEVPPAAGGVAAGSTAAGHRRRSGDCHRQRRHPAPSLAAPQHGHTDRLPAIATGRGLRRTELHHPVGCRAERSLVRSTLGIVQQRPGRRDTLASRAPTSVRWRPGTSSTGSRDFTVAIIDTGIDYIHPDLADNIWSAPSQFTVRIGGQLVNGEIVGGQEITCAAGTHGFNAITRTCDPYDDHYHGTHVAGTIGAVGNNNLGVTGVNWTTSIMAAKFLDANGLGSIADAIDAIEFVIQASAATGANVRVLSNSWSGPRLLAGVARSDQPREHQRHAVRGLRRQQRTEQRSDATLPGQLQRTERHRRRVDQQSRHARRRFQLRPRVRASRWHRV